MGSESGLGSGLMFSALPSVRPGRSWREMRVTGGPPGLRRLRGLDASADCRGADICAVLKNDPLGPINPPTSA